MKLTATTRPVIEARSQFVGGFACSWLDRCGRGSPARLLSHNRALREQFGRDWVVGCSRWIGASVKIPERNSTTTSVHVFLGLSATLGVVSCRCLGMWKFHLFDDRSSQGSIEECLGGGGSDNFVENNSTGACIVNGEGKLVAALEGEPGRYDMRGWWVSNKKWLVRVEVHASARKLNVWRMNSNGVPVSNSVGVRCTVPLSGCCVRLSPFDPCGDVIVIVGKYCGSEEEEEEEDPPWFSSISFVDLEKSIEARVTVVVSERSFFLPNTAENPCDLVWSSPRTILILYDEVGGGSRVFNTETGHSRSFSEVYRSLDTIWPSHIVGLCKHGETLVREVYSVSSPSDDLSQPSCCYEYFHQNGIYSTSKEVYCALQTTTMGDPATVLLYQRKELEVSIGETTTGKYLAVLTITPQPPTSKF